MIIEADDFEVEDGLSGPGDGDENAEAIGLESHSTDEEGKKNCLPTFLFTLINRSLKHVWTEVK